MECEYTPNRTLGSADSGEIAEPRVQTKHGEAAFSCYAARKWNENKSVHTNGIKTEVKSAPSMNVFFNSR